MVEENAFGSNYIPRKLILEKAGLTDEEFWTAIEYLSSSGLIKGTAGGINGLELITGDGLSYYEDLHSSQTPSYQIGAVFLDSVSGSQIQAFASAIENNLQQVISQSPPEDLLNSLLESVDKLFDDLKSELNREETKSYLYLIDEFRHEIQIDQPDRSKIHEILSKLFFLGDVEDLISFGDRVFKLANRTAPYLPIIMAQLERYFSLGS